MSLQSPSAIPRWQLERARALHRICQAIERRLAHGAKLRKLIREKSFQARTRHYRTDRTRKFRLCPSTLYRLYSVWRKHGRTPAAFTLRYRSGKPPLALDTVEIFVRMAITTDACSFRQTWQRLLQPRAGTASAYHHAVPLPLRRQLTQLFATRRRAHFIARRLARA